MEGIRGYDVSGRSLTLAKRTPLAEKLDRIRDRIAEAAGKATASKSWSLAQGLLSNTNMLAHGKAESKYRQRNYKGILMCRLRG